MTTRTSPSTVCGFMMQTRLFITKSPSLQNCISFVFKDVDAAAIHKFRSVEADAIKEPHSTIKESASTGSMTDEEVSDAPLRKRSPLPKELRAAQIHRIAKVRFNRLVKNGISLKYLR